MASSRLDEIVEHHRQIAAADERDTADLLAAARAARQPVPFADALRNPGLSVIAEVKRRSPSAGELAPELDPASLASAYTAGGAAAVSVLTDERFFGGSVDDLRAVRTAVDVPVLRKDFTVHPHDVYDARIMGADAVLLIVAALSDDELAELHKTALDVGLGVLVEVHNGAELERALAISPEVIGVNQRNLADFTIDTELAISLRAGIPVGTVAVAESGIRNVEDARRMADAGFDAVLVGTSLVTNGDAAAAVKAMSACS